MRLDELCPNFGHVNNDQTDPAIYDSLMLQYETLARTYAEIRLFMKSFALSRGMYYKSPGDMEKTYLCFSVANRQSRNGQQVQEIIRRERLLRNQFTNLLFPNTLTGNEEPIVRDTTRYTLVICHCP